MKTLVVGFVRDTEGQDLIEYAFLTGFIALTMIASFTALQANIAALVIRIRGMLLGGS